MKTSKVLSLFLALALCLVPAVSAMAAESDEIEITWLSSAKGQPITYNREMNYLTVLSIVPNDYGVHTSIYALINLETGKLIEEYHYMGHFSEGLATVMKCDVNGSEKWGFIDKTRKIAVPLKYDKVWAFSDGLALVMKRYADGSEKYGFIDKTGKIAIPLEYHGVWNFSGGLARVEKTDADRNRKYGFVDQAGKVVLPLEYDDVSTLSGGLCWVKKGDNYGVFENPYYVPLADGDGDVTSGSGETDSGSRDTEGSSPVVPVAVIAVAAIAAVAAVALALKAKKPPAEKGPIPPAPVPRDGKD